MPARPRAIYCPPCPSCGFPCTRVHLHEFVAEGVVGFHGHAIVGALPAQFHEWTTEEGLLQMMMGIFIEKYTEVSAFKILPDSTREQHYYQGFKDALAYVNHTLNETRARIKKLRET